MQSGRPSGWGEMPHELLPLVFKNVNASNDLLSSRGVCTFWKNAHDSFPEVIKRECVTITKENANCFVSSCLAPIVRNIRFRAGEIGNADFTQSFVETIKCTLETVEFRFHANYAPYPSAHELNMRTELFRLVMKNCKSLVQLHVRSTEILFIREIYDGDTEISFPNIKNLELQAPSSAWPYGRGLRNFILSLPKLEHFSFRDPDIISHRQVGPNGLIDILSSHMKQHRSLKIVILDCVFAARDVSLLLATSIISKSIVNFGEARIDMNYLFHLLQQNNTSLDSSSATFIQNADLAFHIPGLPRDYNFEMQRRDLQSMRYCSEIRDLHIYVHQKHGSGELGFVKHMSKLETLWLIPIMPISECIGIIRPREIFGDGLPSLQKLVLEGCMLHIYSMNYIISGWFPNLRYLQLSRMAMVPEDIITQLAGLKTLATLKLESCDVTDAAMTVRTHNELDNKPAMPAIALLLGLTELQVTSCRQLTGRFITLGVAHSTTLRRLRLVVCDERQKISFLQAVSSVYRGCGFSVCEWLRSIDVSKG